MLESLQRATPIVRDVLITVLLFSTPASAQRVESSLYDGVLRSLLSHSVPEIGVQEARKTESCTWLDARERVEFDVSHIKGARHVGYQAYEGNVVARIDRSACVIVYCSVGYRSEKIAEKFHADGFRDVRNLYGGIFEWVNRGFRVVDSDGEPTEKVHAYGRTWGVWLRRGVKVY